jgi:AcrR family transcriptional regulator
MPVRQPTDSPRSEPRAPYVSALRSEHARETRRAIVSAASALFVEQGYAATTIDAVAERAGVGRKTVFSSVGGKGALLKLAWDWALVGDDEPIPMVERPVVQAIVAERDPARLVRMWADMVVDAGSRAVPIGTVVLAAADVDADARALLDLIQSQSLTGATLFVTHLADAGGLRSDLTVERAADACWALVNSLLQHLLVSSRGWTLQEYAEWLERVAAATLLEPGDPVAATVGQELRIVDNAGRHRYEAWVGARPAGHLTYQRDERLLVLLHTEVDPAFEDRGVAEALARGALDDLRADGSRRVVAACGFASWWIARHPEYAPLLYDDAEA